MEIPIKMDDLGVPLLNTHVSDSCHGNPAIFDPRATSRVHDQELLGFLENMFFSDRKGKWENYGKTGHIL